MRRLHSIFSAFLILTAFACAPDDTEGPADTGSPADVSIPPDPQPQASVSDVPEAFRAEVEQWRAEHPDVIPDGNEKSTFVASPWTTTGTYNGTCPLPGYSYCWLRNVEYNRKKEYYNNSNPARYWSMYKANYIFCMNGLSGYNGFSISQELIVHLCTPGSCQQIQDYSIYTAGSGNCRQGEVWGLPLALYPGNLKHAEMFVKFSAGSFTWNGFFDFSVTLQD